MNNHLVRHRGRRRPFRSKPVFAKLAKVLVLSRAARRSARYITDAARAADAVHAAHRLINLSEGAGTTGAHGCAQSGPGSRGHTKSAAAGPRGHRATIQNARNDSAPKDAESHRYARTHQLSPSDDLFRATRRHAAAAEVRVPGHKCRHRLSAVLRRYWICRCNCI